MEILHRSSPNAGPRPEGVPIDMLVLHYTGMETAAAALARLCDPQAQVSAHYLIEEDGRIHALVDESLRAWHAGVAFWRGHRDVNSRSIGIELAHPGHEFGYRAFAEAQMTALIGLARDILARHPIPARNVIAHSDVAPARKSDPGELFDWSRLARAGIGLWPEGVPGPIPPDPDSAAQALRAIGYDCPGPPGPELLAAFQRHFRPERVDGVLDGETCARLRAVAALCDA